MKIFFDSSALAKRYVHERGSETIDELCQQATYLGVSVICVPEVISALCRLRREKKITKKDYEFAKGSLAADIEDSIICNLTEYVIEMALTVLEKNNLRAMDALHIGCALGWQADLFVTADKRQATAACKSGLKVIEL